MVAQFLSVMLICASTVASSDCTRETAWDVVTQPADTPMACLMVGQTAVAQSALVDDLGHDAYLKVVCERPKTVASGGK
jgi:hypothetical protein